MASNAGIQKLLQAEGRAEETVASARNQRTILLRRAKDDAEVEIAQMRAEFEARLAEYTAEHTGSSDAMSAQLENEQKAAQADARNAATEGADDVVALLLDAVSNVNTSVHRNTARQMQGL